MALHSDSAWNISKLRTSCCSRPPWHVSAIGDKADYADTMAGVCDALRVWLFVCTGSISAGQPQ